jgi:hypothetical protein
MTNDLADKRLKENIPEAVRAKYEWLKHYVAQSAQGHPEAGGQ